MKKFLIVIIAIFFSFINVNALEFDITSSAVIIASQDGRVLYSKNANEKKSIASLTKIMTAIVSLENIDDLDGKVIISKSDYDGVYENNLATSGLKIGQEVTYRDLLNSLLIKSGAEAATALSHNVSGDTSSFVELMNEKAKDIGLNNTHFANPIGLDDAENYSTAADVLKMFKYALKNKEFYKIVTTSKYKISDGTLTFSSSIRKSQLVGDYLLGGKTGTTEDAGLCLASFAKDNDEVLSMVTLGVKDNLAGKYNFYDTKTIYDYYINNYEKQLVLDKEEPILKIKTKYLKDDYIYFYLDKDVYKYLENDFDVDNLKYEYNGIEEITSKMKKNKKLGVLKIKYKDEVLYKKNIYLEKKYNFSVIKFIKVNYIYFIIVGIIVIISLFLLKKKRSNKN